MIARGWRWAAVGLAVPAVLWALVPSTRELAAVSLRAERRPAGADAFDTANRAGIARLRTLLAIAPDRLDWRRELALALEDAGRPAEAVEQWLRIAGGRGGADADRVAAARELIGHGRAAAGIAIWLALAEAGHASPEQLREAAEAAGAAGLWPEAARLLDALARVAPRDPFPVEALAAVEDRQGHAEAALAAWRRRLDLPGATPMQVLAATALLERLGRPAEALALLERDAGAGDLAVLRERAAIASSLGRAHVEIDARRELERRVPGDAANRLALADRLLAVGEREAAIQRYTALLAAADDDPDTLAELAARRLDGMDPRPAAPLLARLAALPEPPDLALELLAREAGPRDPASAAAWLDQLHARGGGDARSWLVRGQLARRLGDGAGAQSAWQQALALAPASATDPEVRDVRALTLAALAEPPAGRALAGVRSWALFYGASAPIERLQQPDLLVLEPEQPLQPAAVRRSGQRILAYLSLGEVHRSRRYYALLADRPGVLASPDPNWQGAVAVDPRSPIWWGAVLDRIMPTIRARGFDGLFLDTLDTAAALEASGRYPGAKDALAGLVKALHARYPRMLLVANGGLALLPKVAPALDGVAIESVFTDYRFKPATYRPRAPDAAARRARELHAVLDRTGLPVFAVEYLDPTDAAGRAAVEARVRQQGWLPYVGPIGLDGLP